MTRLFRSLTHAWAIATAILLGARATSVSAQPERGLFPSAAPKPIQYPAVYEAARQLRRDHDLPKAMQALESASRSYPELPSARVMMYQILARMKEPGPARQQLEEAMRSNPDDPEPWVMLGDIALQERRIAEAGMDFDKAKALLAAHARPERKGTIELQILSGMAQVAEIREDWKEAEARLRDLLKLAPKDLLTHRRLAQTLFWQTKAIEAYEILKKGKQIDHESSEKNHAREIFLTPEAILAQYYYAFEGPKASTGAAETWFKYALRKAPDDLPTRQAVADWAFDQGDIPKAKLQAEAALRIEADDARRFLKDRIYRHSSVGSLLRGRVALWEKDWPAAEFYFEKVVLECPMEVTARNGLALALAEQDYPAKKQRALDYAEVTCRNITKSSETLSILGWVCFRCDEFDRAGAAFGQVVEMDGGNITDLDAVTYIAHWLQRSGEEWKAKAILAEILQFDRPFSMRPEARKLYKRVKGAKKP